jgi:hypothetical protein
MRSTAVVRITTIFDMAGLGCNTHHKDRWNYFFGFLKERGIPQETSPIDYPEDILKTFQAIMDQDYRDANNGESPKPINISDTELFKMVFNLTPD